MSLYLNQHMLFLLASEFYTNATFGEGLGRIWMGGLTCGTTELSLFSCSSTTQLGSVESTTTCTHANDVSVRCQGLETGSYSHFVLKVLMTCLKLIWSFRCILFLYLL